MSSAIYLVGLPGSGKTSVGRHLARRLQLPFADTDALIEQRIGCSIRAYFEQYGEDQFRDVEQNIIEAATRQSHGVLSTGGGAVLRAANRDHLHGRGHVIYLSSTPEALFRRLRHDTHRPLLQVNDPLIRLRDLFALRDPLYREVAHFVIETGRPSVAALTNTIVMQLELAGVV